MPHILSVGTAVPPYEMVQDETMRLSRELFSGTFDDLDRLLQVFANGQISRRHFCVPSDWFRQEHSFAEKNRLYIEHACELGTQAVQRCLQKCQVDPREIDCLIFVSTTGLSTPSIDARMLNRLGMREEITRIPIWGLGCAAGAAGISRASDYAKAFPQSLVLLVSVELCGLTFTPRDKSKSNLIAASLFGDGAAAVLVAGDQWNKKRSAFAPLPAIVGYASNTWKDSLDVMGWKVTDDGLQVIFSRDIPTIVKQHIRPAVERFLARYTLDLSHISRFVPHPGGAKVITSYREALGFAPSFTEAAENVLANYGNMSSATVLFVLEQSLNNAWKDGEYGLVTALGPGFSSELILLKSEG